MSRVPFHPDGNARANDWPQFPRLFSSESLRDDPHGDAAAYSTEGRGGGGSAGGPDAGTTGGDPFRPQPDPDVAAGFIRRLFPGSEWDGHILLWTLDPVSKKNCSNWLATMDEAEKVLKERVDLWRPQDVYIGMGMSGPGLRRGNDAGDLSPHRRLLAEPPVDKRTGAILPTPCVHVIPGVWADVDYGEEGHTANNGQQYPPDLEAVLQRLPELPLQPTIVVHSGHGLQLFWRFDQLFDVSSQRAAAADRQAGWIDLLRQVFRPYALDSVIDLARVMRLPGFINNKLADRPVPVTIVSNDGPTTTPDAIDEILSSRQDSNRGRRVRESASSTGEPFTFDQNAAPHGARFRASYENSPRFAETWDGHRPDLKDSSDSGYDMSLANQAAALGWAKQEIIDLLIARRRKAGARAKPPSYYELTVLKASDAPPQKTDGSRGNEKSQGSGGGKSSSTREAEIAAVERYINRVEASKEVIHWNGEFFQVQGGIWRYQSSEFFKGQMHEVVAQARGRPGHALISREFSVSSLQSLTVAVTPPCIYTSLLPVEDRLKNFHLDTGEVLPGSAFTNGVLLGGEDGDFRLVDRDLRHFYTTSRPYPFPSDKPPRPHLFETWLIDRLPDEDTRTALWEVLGATVAQELHAQQRVVALVGPGRSGKGTALRIASMLVGKQHSATFTGGPTRMAKSQFSLSGLDRAALVLLPDIPQAPLREGIRREHFLEGLAYLKSIGGGDPILIERKNKDPITAIIAPSVWMDSNFPLSGFIQGQEDSYSWQERIITIPFLRSLTEEEREKNFERKFEQELGQIAWYAVEAYSKAKARAHFTWSTEMVVEHVRLSQGKDGALERFFQLLYERKGTWISRTEVRSAADSHTAEKLDHGQAAVLYRYCEAIHGVFKKKRRGTLGFKNLGMKDSDQI